MLLLRHILVATVVGMLLVSSSTALAREIAFKVIVNPKNPIVSLRSDFLRNAFLKKEAVWSNGETIRPIDVGAELPVRDQFARTALNKTPAQLRIYWNQQIFSGKGVPPPEVESIAEVIAYVLANPGAISYLPIHTDARGAKVIEVR